MTIFQNVRKGLIPARLTVAEVVALGESGALPAEEKFELIEGEVVPMSPVRCNWHEGMKRKFAKLLYRTLPDEFGVFVETSIAFSDDTYLIPDLAVFSVTLSTEKARGPDLLFVVEVATSSIAFDTTKKAQLYASFGVREYWVVDAVRQTTRVHRAPADNAYTDVEEYEAHDEVSAAFLPGVTIRLDRLD